MTKYFGSCLNLSFHALYASGQVSPFVFASYNFHPFAINKVLTHHKGRVGGEAYT